MIYEQVIKRYASKAVANCGVIGAGYYNSSLITQELATKRLHVCLVCNRHPETARQAYELAGIPDEKIVYCSSVDAASAAINAGYYVFTDNPDIVLDAPEIDVVVEGTGNSEAASRYCLKAIENGKHIVMVTKGMDSVIGPIIRKLAAEKGLVYTQADGDQPALLIAMVEWARLAGLEVISAGKAIDFEYNIDEQSNQVYLLADEVLNKEDVSIKVSSDNMKYLGMIPEGKAQEYIEKRKAIFKELPAVGAYDLCELTVMANATGLEPVSQQSSEAALRLRELPVAYCTEADGGILKKSGVIDLVINIHRPDEGGMGGGVYMVVKASNPHSQHILATKGQIANYDGSAVVLYRPWHLCGVETNVSAICAGLLGVPTGADSYQQNYDMVRMTTVDIKKGEVFKGDREPTLKGRIVPATRMSPESAVPAHLLNGNIAARDIKANSVITYADVVRPADSTLWALRELQENMSL